MVKNPLCGKVRSGGCQCGAVRYSITVEFGKAGICHCRMCQKAFGNFGAALVSIAATGVQWTRGSAAEFRSSAIVARGFCAACGTLLYMREDGDPNYEIAIGSLDEPNEIAPMTEQSGIESRVNWFAGLRDLPQQITPDYRSAEDLQKLKSLQHPDHGTEQ